MPQDSLLCLLKKINIVIMSAKKIVNYGGGVER